MGTNTAPVNEKEDVIDHLSGLISLANQQKLPPRQLAYLTHVARAMKFKKIKELGEWMSDGDAQALDVKLITVGYAAHKWRQAGIDVGEHRYRPSFPIPYTKADVHYTLALAERVLEENAPPWRLIGDLGLNIGQITSLLPGPEREQMVRSQISLSELREVEEEESIIKPSINLLSMRPVAIEERPLCERVFENTWGDQVVPAPTALVLGALLTTSLINMTLPVRKFCHVGPECITSAKGRLMVYVDLGKIFIRIRPHNSASIPLQSCLLSKPRN